MLFLSFFFPGSLIVFRCCGIASSFSEIQLPSLKHSMYATDLVINNLNLLFTLSSGEYKFDFDFLGYASFYNSKIYKGQIARCFSDFTFRITKKLKITVFLSRNLDYWLTEERLCALFNHISMEIAPFINNPSHQLFQFNLQQTNVHSKFNLIIESKGVDSKIGYSGPFMQSMWDAYKVSIGSPQELPVLDNGDGNDVKLTLYFPASGLIRIQKRNGTIICNSFQRLVELRDWLRTFLSFASIYAELWKELQP